MDFSYKFIPIFEHSDQLESYLTELEAYTQIVEIKPNDLITISLLKSKKTDLLQNLASEQRNSIQEYAKCLRELYGDDPDTQRFSFSRLTQKLDEDYRTFFNRLKIAYFALHGLKPPNTIEKDDQADLRYHFISRIRNNDIRNKLVIDETPFDQLPATARRLELLFSIQHFTQNKYHTDTFEAE